MNRQRIASVVSVLAVVTVGALTYTIAAPDKPNAPEVYVDGGVSGPNRALACEMAFDGETDPPGKRYRTVAFGVYIHPSGAGERDVLLPPNMPRVASKRAVDFMDWEGCRSYACDANAIAVAACAKWLDARPWVNVPAAQSRHVIPDCRDGGVWDDSMVVDCLRSDGDGGFRWAGCNVMPRAESSGAQCLPAPTGTVWAGERVEDSIP